MLREKLHCTICGAVLENGLDTFGDIGEELCQVCWIHLPEIVDWAGSDILMTLEIDDQKVTKVTFSIEGDDDDLGSDDYEEDFDDWDDPDDFDSALSECGIGQDGLCSMAGSEFCDWECPLLKFGFHGTEIDDDDE